MKGAHNMREESRQAMERNSSNLSEKRQIAKKRRDKGITVMKERGFNSIQWTRNFDPLFDVKGKKRHELVKKGEKSNA